jgi:hypothetical protein
MDSDGQYITAIPANANDVFEMRSEYHQRNPPHPFSGGQSA